jgi:hypothetical protein
LEAPSSTRNADKKVLRFGFEEEMELILIYSLINCSW